MGIIIRDNPKGSNCWWIFICHQKKRRSIKIGPNKRLAEKIAGQIQERLILNEFNIRPKRKIDDIDYAIFLEFYDMEIALNRLRRVIAQKEKNHGD